MADFTSIVLQANTNTNGSPTWTTVLGTNKEIRWFNSSTAGLSTASADWPGMARPTSTQSVDYAYAYTADAVGLGVLGSGGAPTTFSNSNYMQYRWNWDNSGTFASAPIFTVYASGSHDSVTRGDGTLLGGHITDTGSTARSYLKANAFGRVVSAGAPAAAPGTPPSITAGTTGSISPTAGANWLSNYQGLQGDNDFITAPFTPDATTADQWNVMMSLYTGPNMAPTNYTPVASLKYTFS